MKNFTIKLNETQRQYMLAFLHNTKTENVDQAGKLVSLFQMVQDAEPDEPEEDLAKPEPKKSKKPKVSKGVAICD